MVILIRFAGWIARLIGDIQLCRRSILYSVSRCRFLRLRRQSQRARISSRKMKAPSRWCSSYTAASLRTGLSIARTKSSSGGMSTTCEDDLVSRRQPQHPSKSRGTAKLFAYQWRYFSENGIYQAYSDSWHDLLIVSCAMKQLKSMRTGQYLANCRVNKHQDEQVLIAFFDELPKRKWSSVARSGGLSDLSFISRTLCAESRYQAPCSTMISRISR